NRQPPTDSFLKRGDAQRADDHEVIVDELRRPQRQDVRVLQLSDQPHLAAKILKRRTGEQVHVRNLQRDADALDLVASLVNDGKSPLVQLLLDDVLAELLLRPQGARPTFQSREYSASRSRPMFVRLLR